VDEPWTVTIINVNTGTVVGTVDGVTILWNALSYKSRTWDEHIRIGIVTGEGEGTVFQAPIVCAVTSAGHCTATGRGLWAGQVGLLTANVGEVFSGDLGWTSPRPATTRLRFRVDMTFAPVQANPVPITIGPAETIRCDSEAIFRPTNGGCVYLHATANVLVLSAKDHTITQAAQFMRAAQKDLRRHPGVLGAGPALTRLTNASQVRRNRRVACKGLTVRNGQSCDEYPFASTYQGAALAGPGNFRREAVNARQNSKVGTYLGIFFLRFRIADRDSFYVLIVG
jgi:hypothetical protein